jgi:hypothetical protein
VNHQRSSDYRLPVSDNNSKFVASRAKGLWSSDNRPIAPVTPNLSTKEVVRGMYELRPAVSE